MWHFDQSIKEILENSSDSSRDLKNLAIQYLEDGRVEEALKVLMLL